MLGLLQLIFSLVIFIVWFMNNLDLLKFRQWQNFKETQNYNCDKQLKIEGLDKEILNNQLDRCNDLHDFGGERMVLQLKGPDAVEFKSQDGSLKMSSFTVILKFQHETSAVLMNTFFEYQLCYILMSTAGIFVNQLFFIFHMYDIVQRFPELMNILQAITGNQEMLILTLLLSVILTQIYTLIGFIYFPEAWQFPGSTDSAGRPQDYMSDIKIGLMYNVNVGIRSGGGHINNVSIHDPKQFSRLVYDQMFIIIIVVILMNILFGIVLDTFAELYETNKELQKDINDVCFICELYRDNLEKQGVSFDQHVAYDHSWVNQLQYILHLSKKDRAFQNGVELEISAMIDKNEVNFFPRQEVFDLKIEKDEDGEAESLNTAQLLESTQRIKSDLKKINELLDEKLQNQ